ncbi:MAG: threonine--tRNA ligase [Clostridia bacterium]|nr:threonine--tRNA ligase [Clostridia bacterium]
MGSVSITLKDGSIHEIPRGTAVMDVVKGISQRLAREALVARFNEQLVDLNSIINGNGKLEILTFDDAEAREVYWHSTSHILAQAVKNLYPEASLGIGPAISNGYYYDFDVVKGFSPEEVEAIEAEMKKIIKENYSFKRRELSLEEALDLFTENKEPYKVELIKELPEDSTISIYEQGGFMDLCAGPHIPSTGRVRALKLLNVAGAYWKGSERNPMLQRIYGTSYPKKKMLDEHLFKIEEAKRRDHRKLGTQLDLFSLHDEGPGFPFFHNKGMIIWNELENYWRKEHRRHGYEEIKTPIILDRGLWERSGHWDHYHENMYFTEIDEVSYALKPMNCPGSILVYKTKQRSYRDFPLRMAELGLVHRHELSGVLHGLMRVRSFNQDDAHIFMLPSQIKDEIVGVIEMIDDFYSVFGFEYKVELSTKPGDAMGSDEIWEQAIEALRDAVESKNIEYCINEGDGAFYGPKLDFHLEDCLGRTWQCGTIQLDFLFPENFDLSYIGSDGEKHRPVMIHRVIFGSIERFIGILIEHYGGAFPTWLAPVQVLLLPIADRHQEYAAALKEKLESHDIRVEIDSRNEKIGYKIREGETQKVPYMVIVGDNEVKNKNLSIRKRKVGDMGTLALEEFLEVVKREVRDKTQ